MSYIQTIDDACEFIWQYGNICNNLEDLKLYKPSQEELKRAYDTCLKELNIAFRLVSDHHNVSLNLESK